jgi:hypothetical protein
MVANFFIHPRPVGSMQIPAPVRAREETTDGSSTYQNTFRDTDALARSYDPEAVSSMQDSDEDLDPKSEKHNVSSMNFAELKLAVLRIKVQRQYSTRTRPLCAISQTTKRTGETREPSRPELNSLDFWDEKRSRSDTTLKICDRPLL